MKPHGDLWPLACPVCHGQLTRAAGSLRCEDGHTFDIAREGYVHLLPSRRRLSPTAGDSAEMLTARRAFLDAGHYAPLGERIGVMVAAYLRRRGRGEARPAIVVDAGCGEGYYGGAARAAIVQRLPGVAVRGFGVDIAGGAVRLAARRHREALFAVADCTRHLPFLDATVDVLLNVFAPRGAEEFARVAAPGGLLLCVIPAPDHLQSLRRTLPLIGIEQEKAAHVGTRFAAAFTQTGSDACRFELPLEGDDLRRLVTMMPSYRHLRPEGRQALSNLGAVKTNASFTLLQFERRAGEDR